LLKFSPAKEKFSGPKSKEDQMLNFFNQRRAWDDLIIVFLKCGCSGAGLTISAAMAMAVVAWGVFRRKATEESRDRFSTSTATDDMQLAAKRPNAPRGETLRLRKFPHR
jgi:uncharacterized protein (TIGR03382 family)